MPRFFVSTEDIIDGIAKITADDARHIARSLRMAAGDTVTICNGLGTEYTARLTKIRDEECLCEIIDEALSTAEPKIELTLFMAYPKGDKLEIVTQKSVELGVSHIIPFESSRCIKKPSNDKEEKNIARLTRIADEAAKQCGRARLARVHGTMDFSTLLSAVKNYDKVLFCYECATEDNSLKKALTELNAETTKSIAVIVGSEGGFSEQEAAALVEHGAIPVSLGKRILRCETAPTFIFSAISYQYEL